MERVGAAVVGGGAVGTAVAWQLAEAGVGDVFLLEKEPRLCEGQSGRSSGVVHAGIYYAEGSLKARLCPGANAGMYEFCSAHGVPCEKVEKLVVASSPEELPGLEEVRRRATANGVPGLAMLTRRQVSELEPGLSAEAALLVPTTGVVDAAALVAAIARLAERMGATVLAGFEVTGIEARGGTFEVTGRRAGREETFETELLVNAAGLWCDAVGRMVDPDLDASVVGLRGEYVRVNRRKRPGLWLSGRNVYPVPEPLTVAGETKSMVGTHLTPTFALAPDGSRVIGDLFTVGPEFRVAPARDDYETGRLPAAAIVDRAKRYYPDLREADADLDYAGVMVHVAGQSDWVLRRDGNHPNALHLLGIDSPGLTCCLALGRLARETLVG